MFLESFGGLATITSVLQFATNHQESNGKTKSQEFKSFQQNYLVVYLLSMFADWLQGPYVYKLYQSYGYDKSSISMLFIVGFSSSMIAGTMVASLADTYGRKKMCIAYCVIYIISGIMKLWTNFWILIVGRILSGIATSLLFSVFEAWMVCEHTKRGYDPALLSSTFRLAVFGNGLVAVLAGLVANYLVSHFGYVAPYIAIIFPLSWVMIIVYKTWPENCGDSSNENSGMLLNALSYISSNSQVAALGTSQACFEGAMYIFVFMWTPALESGGALGTVPHGIVFANFMLCIMIGSSFFSLLNSKLSVEVIPRVIQALAFSSMLPAALSENASIWTYVGFLCFEISCGLFFPTFGTLRSKLIPEATRVSVMNLFRIPLNFIVITSLCRVDSMSATDVFSVCAGLHLFAFLLVMVLCKESNAKAKLK